MNPKSPKKQKTRAALSLVNNRVFLIEVEDRKWDLPKIHKEKNLTILENFKLLQRVLRNEISVDTDVNTPFMTSCEKNGEEIEFCLVSITTKHPVCFGQEVPLEQLDRYAMPEATKLAIQKLSALCGSPAL